MELIDDCQSKGSGKEKQSVDKFYAKVRITCKLYDI